MSPASPSRAVSAYLSSATNSAEQMAKQAEIIHRAAARDGYAVNEHMLFREERRFGSSNGPIGRDPDRPILSAFLTELKTGRLTCERLYVADLSRLSRDRQYCLDTLTLLGSYGVAVVSGGSGLPVDLKHIAQIERDAQRDVAGDLAVLSERLRSGYDRRRAAGSGAWDRSTVE